MTEKKFEFISGLTESRLIPGRNHIKNMTAKDVADLVYLYLIALQIMKSEFILRPIAMNYAKRTIQYQNFDQFRIGGTDLYILLHILMGKNNKAQQKLLKGGQADEVFLKKINLKFNDLRRYLYNIWKDRDQPSLEWQLLFKLDKQLQITTSSYRSMRRLAAKWNELSHYQQQLVITRLLMALRTRARRSELLPMLERFSKEKRLEIKKGVCNPETGEGCADNEAQLKRTSLLKKLAIGGLLAGGAAFALKKRKKTK